MGKDSVFDIFKKSDYYKVSYFDIEEIVDNNFVKELRKKLDMTQNVFASVLGVTKKTVEKWEQGRNPIKGCSARLLYLIDNNIELINEIYKVEYVKSSTENYTVIKPGNIQISFTKENYIGINNSNNSMYRKDNNKSTVNEKNANLGLCC